MAAIQKMIAIALNQKVAVWASHAAALPQPAGLSEQYSNSVDATLASCLELDLPPESNSYKIDYFGVTENDETI
ncbi:hypothetical protein BASA61_002432 [Batrachochytrium salamandrivorans]|nr:hypothetical protein BASA61_002432 [Batrachochytrium salamandrivorans]